tara:strand:+ start:720 stop:1001 length:282 start_codon:yes stop_codon:yes gene_type:complete
MKFKVINDKSKEVIESNLTVMQAREMAWSLNKSEDVDHFYVSSKPEETPHRNGEVVSNVVKREIKELLSDMMNQYPNDASLGAAIRVYQQNTN